MPEDKILGTTRIKVFIDYWNLQLLVNQITHDEKASLDWQKIGDWLAKQACLKANIPTYSFEGVNIYTSYNPKKDKDSYFKWVNNFLNRQAGVQVYCLERQTKAAPKCPTCHKSIGKCSHCQSDMIGSVEKGVDALIVTDLIRLAWEGAYDIAVLASSDRDLIPGVKFLDAKGKKVIHAGFPPIGSDLAQACWASFNIATNIKEIIRPSKKTA